MATNGPDRRALMAAAQKGHVPGPWATHLGWAAALTFIIFRGPGALSIDYFLRPSFEQRGRGVCRS